MIKVFIGKLIPGVPHIPLLFPNLGKAHSGGALFTHEVFRFFATPVVEIVEIPTEADFILLPHAYVFAERYPEYLSSILRLSKETHKPVIIFAYGDIDVDVAVPNSIIFRYAQYRYKKRPNEFIMPPYSGDLLEGSLSLKDKHEGPPTVGFCGWASYRSIFDQLKAGLKNLAIDFEKIIAGSRIEARKKGIYFRQRALRSLSDSSLVEPNFIIRSSHGLHRATIDFDAGVARQEYIKNILDSDLCLAVKGDGNASVRFYEILSLGRIPLFVDTESLLPFEDKINYEDFIVRVDYSKLGSLPKRAADFYATVSPEAFLEKQRSARAAFEKYLRIDSFFKEAFKDPEILKKMAQ